MSPDDPRLGLLVCPLDKGPLHLVTENAPGGGPAAPRQVLYNPRLRRRYPVRGGVPHLLPSAGDQVGAGEHAALLSQLTG
ncbi:Trm112 family protein [Streptomyces sp. DSM 44917]|uniref:Trm112 family protein n=1 Tax=Streptomyces boetiae TaxID=3075541 RepID=A0ABU2LAD4_9ACTN|nr:Trm112 family protein [Streptomyces sp. DSM 44917]MDT0308287.1 Trm112 family protein [Streptomyces sp. DSM 44917]